MKSGQIVRAGQNALAVKHLGVNGPYYGKIALRVKWVATLVTSVMTTDTHDVTNILVLQLKWIVF